MYTVFFKCLYILYMYIQHFYAQVQINKILINHQDVYQERIYLLFCVNLDKT